jgi:hypothetical protein
MTLFHPVFSVTPSKSAIVFTPALIEIGVARGSARTWNLAKVAVLDLRIDQASMTLIVLR